MKVLFVDDDSSVLKQAEVFLEEEDDRLDVETVASVEGGLELLEEHDFDAVVSDYQMPKKGGLEFLKTVREDMDSNIPFIIFTGKGREDVAMDALNFGANRYLQKSGSPKSQYGLLAKAIVQEVEYSIAEEKVEKSEKRYKAIAEKSHDTIFVVGGDELLFVNDSAVGWTGYSKEELYDMNPWDLLHPEDRERVREIDREGRQGEETPTSYEARILTKEGEVKHGDFRVTLIEYEGKSAILGSVRGITERRKKEKELRESEERLSRTQRIARVGSWEIDLQTNELTWSDEVYRIFGLPIGEPVSYEDFLELVYPDDRDYVAKKWDEGLKGEGYDIEHRIKVGDEVKWVLEKADIRFDDEENPVEVIGSVQDITERKEKEKELKKSREKYKDIAEKYKSLFEAIPDAAAFVDDEGVIEEVNQTACEYLECDRDDLEGEFLVEQPFYSGEDRDRFLERAEKVFEGEEVPSTTYEVETAKGNKRHVEVNNSVLREDGEFKGIILIGRDITEKEKTRKELREKKEAVESSINGIVITDLEGKINYVNPAALEMYGYEREEVIGKNSMQFGADEDEIKKVIRSVREEGEWVGELKAEKKDGEIFDVQLSASLIEDDDGNPKGLLGSYIDISDRKEMRKKLRESKERLEKIFESAKDGIVIINLEAKVERANQAAADMIGYEKSNDLVDKNALDFVHPEDMEKAIDVIFRSVEEEKTFPHQEYKILNKDGEMVHTLAGASLLYDDSDNLEGFIVIFRDITERKRKEEREEFLHSLLRHDLKNKIQVVQGYLKKLKELDLREGAELYLKEAVRTTDNEKKLIEKIENLRKVEEAEMEITEIAPVLEEVIRKNSSEAEEKNIRLESNITNHKIQGGSLLEEIFSNLIENSLTHSDCGKIQVEVEEKDENCIVSIIDDGKGIPDEKKEKVFERGFKDGEKSGFGLGLYLVKEIVEGYGGEIEVRDSEEGGARFDVYLTKVENSEEVDKNGD